MSELNTDSFRIKNIRQKKRLVKKDFEKKVRKQHKRSKEILEIRRKIPLQPLEKPYQKGFVRFFVVRDDVKRSKKGDFFEELLKKINTFMYSETRKFQKRKRKNRKKIYVDRPHYLKVFYLQEWEHPKFKLTDLEKSYFVKKEYYDYYTKCLKTYFEFSETWRFVLRIKPNMITQYKPVIMELEQESSWVDDFLDQHKVRGILCKKIYGKSGSWRSKKEVEKDYFKNSNYFNSKISASEYAEITTDLFV